MADNFAGGILAGATSVDIPVVLRVKSDGAELTGKAAANMSAYYWRQGATATQVITLATLGSLGAAYSAGGWYEVDGTNMKGAYRMGLPNTALSTGADWVVVAVKDTAASGFYFYERYALETVHNNLLNTYISGAAISVAAGQLTAAVFGADFITSAKVAAGAFVYDDQITTFKSELSGLVISIPNGHITSAKIGADAIGSDKVGPGALDYGDQILVFDATIKSAASQALAAYGASVLNVADIKSAASAAIIAFAPLTDKANFRLSVTGVRDITQYTSAQGGVPGSSPSLYDATVWNAAQNSFKRIQTPTTYMLYDAAGSSVLASAPISGTSGVQVVIGAFT